MNRHPKSINPPIHQSLAPRSSALRAITSVSLLLLPLVLVLAGCSRLSYTGPAGERFSRFSFGSKTAIASLTVEAGTNGIRRVDLQGYQNDANQALGTVTEAAVRAAVANLPGLKP